jgi:hypothetical protein
MRRQSVILAGLLTALAGGMAVAADPVDIMSLIAQTPPAGPAPAQPAPTPAPPATTIPSAPATAPSTPPTTNQPTTPPGLANQPAVAPVSNTAGTAPQALATAGAGFTPYMMGDLPAASYVRGLVAFPGLVPVVLPPVTVTTPPQIILGPRGNVIAVIPGRTIVLVPARTVFVPGAVTTSVLVPQVGRGDLKIEENESPMPVDRVYVTYNFFDNITRIVGGIPKNDLHRETYGFETTFLDGNASLGVRMNSLQTVGGTTLAGDDFGDLTAIAKLALLSNRETGDVLSVGLAVTAPTGPDAILPDGSRINPTYLQPFVGFIGHAERLFAQGFSSIIVPTDSREATLGTASLGVGYRVYESCDPSAWVRYVTPIVEGHATLAFNHRGFDQPITELSGFPDTFVLTNGLHLGLGNRSNLAVGVAVPLTGPKIFAVEAIVQLNWRF